MRTTSIAAALAATLAATLAVAAHADSRSDWTQSKYGEDDQAGASNLMTPEKAKEAIALMKTGAVMSIGRTYEPEMPLFGARAFALRGTGGLAGGPLGENGVIWMDDFLATEIGQVGTQFDGLGHIGVADDEGRRFYNGTPAEEVVGSYGIRKLGIENVKPIFTRGIVLDIAALRDAPMEAGDEISVADLEAALERQGVAAPGSGDVVLIHTGWGRHWIKDNATFNSGCPGLGIEAAQWLIDKGVAVVGADTWPVEVVPNPDAGLAFPVHQMFLAKNGIYIHENVATERLTEEGVSEFAYIFSPMPVKGATGSAGAPLAVY